MYLKYPMLYIYCLFAHLFAMHACSISAHTAGMLVKFTDRCFSVILAVKLACITAQHASKLTRLHSVGHMRVGMGWVPCLLSMCIHCHELHHVWPKSDKMQHH